MIFTKKKETEDKKGEELVKKVRELFKKDSKEISENLDQLILGQMDDLQYALDKDLGLKEEDAKALSVLMNARNEAKKANWEIFKNVAQTLGISVTALAGIVGIIYTVKGFNFDREWMERIFDFKDSINVMDNKSFNQVSKNRESHRKLAEHMMNKRI